MQPKLDGIRCIMKPNGCYSRNGKKFMNVQHLYTKTIKDLFKQNPLLVLDGELYNHDLRDNFEKIVSLVRKQKPTSEDRKEARKLIQYHVYDFVMAYKGKLDLIESDMNRYEKRMHQLVCSDMYGKHIRYASRRRTYAMKGSPLFVLKRCWSLWISNPSLITAIKMFTMIVLNKIKDNQTYPFFLYPQM